GGTDEILSGQHRYCLWLTDDNVEEASRIKEIRDAIESCREYRMTAGQDARRMVKKPHRFSRSTYQAVPALHVGKVIGNRYAYVPATLRAAGFVSSDAAFTIYRPQGFELAIIASTLHKTWAEAVAGRLGNGVRYGTTVVYNTFPVPALTEKQKSDLTRCAEDILLTREAHFPATIADLYDPDNMPDDLKRAHERNDETPERIYIGRRFRNDTERLEKLFDLYTKMTEGKDAKAKTPKKSKVKS
ncbi:MAG: type IIL restriction-modification enzyme MmeI, partial [Chthoniobacterales bacterium]